MKITTNVFSNTCVGGYMMRLQKVGNNNPCVWTIIPDVDSLIYLISNFDNIDWLNYSFSVVHDDDKNYPVHVMTIDNHIKLKFVHIIEDARYEQPMRAGNGITDVNVRVKDVPAYLEDCYLRRVERMLNENIEPTFVISQGNFTADELKTLEAIKTPYTKLFVLKGLIPNFRFENFVLSKGNEYDKSVMVMKCYNNRLNREKQLTQQKAEKPEVKIDKHIQRASLLSGAHISKLLYT